jgi:hypothetical protein
VEKIVTVIARAQSTRDGAASPTSTCSPDITRSTGQSSPVAIRRVAEHRNMRLRPLAQTLDGYEQIGQQGGRPGAGGSGWRADCRSSSVTSLRPPSTSPTQRSSAQRKAAHGPKPDAPGRESRHTATIAHSPKTLPARAFFEGT